MIKTEMMKKYEQETGCNALEIVYDELLKEDVYSIPKQYGDWLEAKAEAYDRLMSGKGRMTLKELANFKGFPITIDSDWTIKSHGAEPKMVEMLHGAGFWVNEADDEEEIDESFVEIPDDFDWKTSLTLPDGWEATDD